MPGLLDSISELSSQIVSEAKIALSDKKLDVLLYKIQMYIDETKVKNDFKEESDDSDEEQKV